MAPKRRPVPIPGPSPMMRHEVKRARLSARWRFARRTKR